MSYEPHTYGGCRLDNLSRLHRSHPLFMGAADNIRRPIRRHIARGCGNAKLRQVKGHAAPMRDLLIPKQGRDLRVRLNGSYNYTTATETGFDRPLGRLATQNSLQQCMQNKHAEPQIDRTEPSDNHGVGYISSHMVLACTRAAGR
jgi:hypothetical protein